MLQGGVRVRRFGLYVVQETGKMQNPQKEGSLIWAVVEAMRRMGTNIPHPFRDVRNGIRSILSSRKTGAGIDGWSAFVGRSPKNPMQTKDANGRILECLRTHQRLSGSHPYGMKLQQVGACIDLLEGGEDGLLVMLRYEPGKRPRPISADQ